MSRRRRLTEEGGGGGHDGGGSLRWLLTYADMITLLMAFFIMMYSMSVLNLGKFQQVAFSIRSGFGGMVQGQGKSIMGTSGQFSAKPSSIEGDTTGVPWQAVQKIQSFVEQQNLQKFVKMRIDERGLVITLVADKMLFARGQADLSPIALRLIASVGSAIRTVPNTVRVEGHTCNLPIVSDKYPSNWELSTARAATVVRFLIEHGGMQPQRLSAAGYADSKPLVPNNSERNRAVNRRVDIVVLKN
jgi:chemotaxis protein MotB